MREAGVEGGWRQGVWRQIASSLLTLTPPRGSVLEPSAHSLASSMRPEIVELGEKELDSLRTIGELHDTSSRSQGTRARHSHAQETCT